MAPDHPLATRATLTLRDLAGHTMILPDEADSPRLHRWYRAFLDTGPGKRLRYIGAHQIHVALFYEECAAYGLTPVQYSVLTALLREGVLDQASIAVEVGTRRI